MRRDATRLNLDWRYLAIALLPVAVFYIHDTMIKSFGAPELDLSQIPLSEGRDHMELVGRYRFLGAAMFFSAVALMGITAFVGDLARHYSHRTRAIAAGSFLLLAMPVIIPTAGHILHDTGVRVYQLVGLDLMSSTLNRGEIPSCALPDDRIMFWRCGVNPVLSMFENVMDVINIFTGFGVAAAIIGMILTLSHGERGPVASGENLVVILTESQRRSRRYLYYSGLLLTSGMFLFVSWMHWPFPFLEGQALDDYKQITQALQIYFGIFYTVIILSYYIPVAALLSARIDDAGRAALGEDAAGGAATLKAWKVGHGLEFDQVDALRAVFAIVSPLMAGLAGSIGPFA